MNDLDTTPQSDLQRQLEERRMLPFSLSARVRTRLLVLVSLAAIGFVTTGLALADGGEAYTKSYQAEIDGRYRAAIDALDALPAGEKSSYFHHLRKGWLLYNTGEYQDSITAYSDAAKAEPKALEPLLGKMLPQMALRLWEDTVKTCEAAIKLDAGNYLATSRMAWAQYSLGRFADAETSYRTLLALYPSDSEMQAGLGWALFKQGELVKARAAFEAVLQRVPEHTSSLQGIAALGS